MDIFLVVVALALVIVINGVAESVASLRRRVADATLTTQGHQLSHYELAYLAGGPRRAINTALAVLATAGAVRVSRGSEVSAVYGARPSPDPLEQAVLDALAMRPGYRAAELRKFVEASPAIRQIEAGLRGRGLLLDEGAQLAAWQRLEWLKFATAGAVFFAIAVVALTVAGVAGQDFAFAGVALFGVFSLSTGFSRYRAEKRRLRNLVTAEGRRVLASARLYYPRGAAYYSTSSNSVAPPVALYGPSELPDRSLCDGLSAGDPHSDCSGTCGSFSDSGSGSSFGDGGSGGSSCGSSSSDSGSSGSSCGGGGGSSCGSSS